MPTETFTLLPKASISLGLQAHQRPESSARMVDARPSGITSAEALTSAIVEARNAHALADRVAHHAEVDQLSENFLSVRADADTLAELSRAAQVRRVQTKKVAQPHLDAALPDVGLVAPNTGGRPVDEDGTGVLVGIVDSGFDLSHPMFRDSAGRLRVDGLLDQTLPDPREFTTDQLERAWANGAGPGADESGHGTHVAAIAAGSRFGALEGIASGARLLLVKTNYRDTDTAVAWILAKAGSTPCVVNLSLGHHFGAHDGTDAEERLHAELTGPGRSLLSRPATSAATTSTSGAASVPARSRRSRSTCNVGPTAPRSWC